MLARHHNSAVAVTMPTGGGAKGIASICFAGDEQHRDIW